MRLDILKEISAMLELGIIGDKDFDMSVFLNKPASAINKDGSINHCGTVGCIAGYILLYFGTNEQRQRVREGNSFMRETVQILDAKGADEVRMLMNLFDGTWKTKNVVTLYDLTREDAVKELKHFILEQERKDFINAD